RNYDIVIDGEKAGVWSAETGKADVTFQCDTETFSLIAWGRLTIDTALTTDKLKIEGDIGLALEFQRWFPVGANAL
ncbi:MAG: SCP2 sterol-binding domain-containing protein, partial [Chloroflexi bacterium]|nr:SCP2 sterol-binding domain-containing protein [Chloroflexota bacterium]